jgi:hypothetical protein
MEKGYSCQREIEGVRNVPRVTNEEKQIILRTFNTIGIILSGIGLTITPVISLAILTRLFRKMIRLQWLEKYKTRP